LGTIVQSKNPVTSKVEQQVRERLVEAGFLVHKGRSAIQCGHEPVRNNFPILTPDILIRRTKVCVEVDTAYSHGDEEQQDRTRNVLLADVGWHVVRLRLGGLDPIGEHDVVVEGAAVTVDAMTALVAAVSDAVAGRPGTVRRIVKTVSTGPRTKSRLGAIAPHKYYENAFYVSWALDSGEQLRMVAMDSGRYLARALGGEVPRFVCNLGLDRVPRAQWRAALLAVLETMSATDFAPVSEFPWGDELFLGDQAAALRLLGKFYLGTSVSWFTCNLDGFDSLTVTSLLGEAGELARLHPAAVAGGWRIAGVEARTGRYGTYQEIHLAHDDDVGSRSSVSA
jgi:hypothetical protein